MARWLGGSGGFNAPGVRQLRSPVGSGSRRHRQAQRVVSCDSFGDFDDFDHLRGVDFRGASPRCSPTEAAYG
ncbi:hypothetical protein GLX30_18415 [Streptomyces sp. Tu 2975]|uniref:hypothetical protein n=1 Tax=Streptomyces sp. Tu 2975 TaxID=2676871 RepID=UPI001357AA19|nr:hypothetical protein [Streptomyces sp. Tu 2975]QIP85682.1 hypothetical protein GLX30_18415 [Streptomyces sp. Tu 2975]